MKTTFINQKGKSVAYTRVSSKEQEQGYSLDAQKRLAEDYAQATQIEIKKLYQVSESASGKKQRQVFKEMLDYARKGKINNIFVEKIDRLTRNPKEAVMIQEWLEENPANQVHCIKENFVLSRDSKAHEKFIWNIKVSVANFYINNLSEEVKKGLTEKARQGYYPGSFKLGYLSIGEKGKKRFIKNPETYLIVKKLLEMYATGNYSMKALVKKAWELKLLSRFGRKLYKNQIECMLKDPFYYGYFFWNGQLSKGEHEPLISKETFDKIQEIRVRRKAPHYKQHSFLFTKLVNCGECGGTITSEIQKGHVYCHCNHYRDCTQKKYTRQDEMESALLDVMKVFEALTEEEANTIRDRIKANHQAETDYKMSVIENLTTQYKSLQVKIDNLYDDKLSGAITTDFWARKNDSLQTEQKAVQEQLDRLKTQEAQYFEMYLNILELARKARAIYSHKRRTQEQKRLLLKSLFSVITLTNGVVTYTLKKPVQKYQERLKSLENIFEPGKGINLNINTSTDARIASMLLG